MPVLNDKVKRQIKPEWLKIKLHDGEGFAGTIIDAYSAGIPVIASDWKYNTELVLDGKTGLIFKSKDEEDLKKKLISLLDYDIAFLKTNALSEAQKYAPETAIKTLTSKME